MTPAPSNLIPLSCKPTQQPAYPDSCSCFPTLVTTCCSYTQTPSHQWNQLTWHCRNEAPLVSSYFDQLWSTTSMKACQHLSSALPEIAMAGPAWGTCCSPALQPFLGSAAGHGECLGCLQSTLSNSFWVLLWSRTAPGSLPPSFLDCKQAAGKARGLQGAPAEKTDAIRISKPHVEG